MFGERQARIFENQPAVKLWLRPTGGSDPIVAKPCVMPSTAARVRATKARVTPVVVRPNIQARRAPLDRLSERRANLRKMAPNAASYERSPSSPASVLYQDLAEGKEVDVSVELLEPLERKQREWRSLSPSVKGEFAEAVLKSVESLAWRDVWLDDGQLVLEGIETKSDAAKFTASQKFTFGLIAKKYLQSVIKGLAQTSASSTAAAKSVVEGHSVFDLDPLAVPNVKAEAWCLDSMPREDDPAPRSGVCLVLGAGNQNFLSLIDLLDRLFVHDQVVLLKHHPLRPFLFGPYASILQPVIDAGYVRMVQDNGVEFSEKLCCHPLVSHIHVTGAGATHDAICRSLERVGRGSAVEVTCELGCVTPWIVANGTWKEQEIDFQTRILAAAKKLGGGANCLSPQVLILDEDWPQLEAFFSALKSNLRKLADNPSYYPGSPQRLESLRAQYPHNRITEVPCSTRHNGASSKPTLPVTLLDCGVYDDNGSSTNGFIDAALKTEAFCPALAVVRVRGKNQTSFLETAAGIANDECHGSLSCTVSTPSTEGTDLDRALSKLKYGAIGINCSTVFGYISIASGGAWGAYPGLYSKGDCGSGNGYIGNIFQREGYAKTVVRSSCVNSLADISSLPPAVLSDILCCSLLSNSALQGLGRTAQVLISSLASFFTCLGGKRGYKRI